MWSCVIPEPVPGGSWSTSRYEAVQLYHPRTTMQLPMFPVPEDEFQEYPSGEDVGRYYAQAVETLKLPFFGGVNVVRNYWNETQSYWETVVKDVRSGESLVLTTRNIVLSNGFPIGKGNVYTPELADREAFAGLIQHIDEYRTAEPCKDKEVMINSSHDVAKDLAVNGAKSITILQRSPIVFIDFDIMGPVMSMMYQGQMAIEAADFLNTGMPTALA